MRAKKRMIVVISYVVLILVALISIFPLVYAVMIAKKNRLTHFPCRLSGYIHLFLIILKPFGLKKDLQNICTIQ